MMNAGLIENLTNRVKGDIENAKGNIAKVMQEYSDRQQKILDSCGGNQSDLPMADDHPYHVITTQIQILGRISNGLARKD